MKKISIKDVAREAQVATGTVSRVINDHPSVTEEIRVRVRRVIERLGYEPDPLARSMRSKISRLIGIVIPDLLNPFFAELVQHAEQAATSRGHNVIFMTSFDDVGKEADRLAQLASRKVDGIILVPSNGFHALKAPKGVPMVVVDRLLPGYPGISADHRGGAKLAVDYLLKLGHRRIGCIAGPSNSVPAKDRLEGFRDALSACPEAAKASTPLIVEAAFDYHSARLASTYLLAMARDERPTAIFTSSDQQAIGCIRAANDLGIPVPAALSIVSFDRVQLADIVTPRLTAVRQPIGDIASAAVATLLDGLKPHAFEAPMHFQCELVEGESTAPPQVPPPLTARKDPG
ncbi:LacI family DNA-binding transcriptional regulator [Oryzifoliimicrobium ureilyticus]|uniref:LacI family DNA-binding transcriptional regulator n=1 Tax=Oryzifoliimicrobium ureilyticus TaxID=3113724 RepID=UPI0030763D63